MRDKGTTRARLELHELSLGGLAHGGRRCRRRRCARHRGRVRALLIQDGAHQLGPTAPVEKVAILHPRHTTPKNPAKYDCELTYIRRIRWRDDTRTSAAPSRQGRGFAAPLLMSSTQAWVHAGDAPADVLAAAKACAAPPPARRRACMMPALPPPPRWRPPSPPHPPPPLQSHPLSRSASCPRVATNAVARASCPPLATEGDGGRRQSG